MPNLCLAPKCINGLSSTKKCASVSLHKFPLNNSDLLQQWLHRIHRRDLKPTRNSRICSLHFREEDFLQNSIDAKGRTFLLRKAILKPDALPSIFPNCPTYFSKMPIKQRCTLSSKTKAETKLPAENSLINEDLVHTLQDIADRYNKEPDKSINIVFLPNLPNNILFFTMNLSQMPPCIVHTVNIKSDLTFESFVYGTKLVNDTFKNILENNKCINKFSDLLKLLSHLRNRLCTSHLQLSDIIKSIDTCLNTNNSMDEERVKNLHHVRENLYLIQSPPKQRRYSCNYLVFALLIQSRSTSAYKLLRDQHIICLPSIRTLQRLTSMFGNVNSDINLQYLRNRCINLSEIEKVVSLVFDEIYIFEKFDYSNETFVGVSEDGINAAKTVLCFLVKSLASPYRDVIHMVPVNGLTLSKLQQYFTQAAHIALEAGFQVVSITCDNHPTNRAFITNYLCSGNVFQIIENHNSLPLKRFGALIDPTHTLKNIYNIFQRKRIFHLPNFPGVSRRICSQFWAHRTAVRNGK